MDMTYSFNWDTEPSDAQLETLMKEVIADVITRRKAADKAYWELLRKEVERVKRESPFTKVDK